MTSKILYHGNLHRIKIKTNTKTQITQLTVKLWYGWKWILMSRTNVLLNKRNKN